MLASFLSHFIATNMHLSIENKNLLTYLLYWTNRVKKWAGSSRHEYIGYMATYKLAMQSVVSVIKRRTADKHQEQTENISVW